MATFKVGQRVRIVNPRWALDTKDKEAIILSGPFVDALSPIGLRTDVYRIDILNHAGGSWCALADELAPLTNPGEADAWAADAVRKVTKPEPVAPKVPEKVTT